MIFAALVAAPSAAFGSCGPVPHLCREVWPGDPGDRHAAQELPGRDLGNGEVRARLAVGFGRGEGYEGLAFLTPVRRWDNGEEGSREIDLRSLMWNQAARCSIALSERGAVSAEYRSFRLPVATEAPHVPG